MIVPMKKVQIVVLKEDRDKLLENLQKKDVLMLISDDEEVSILRDDKFDEAALKDTKESLKIISKYKEKKSFVRKELVVDYSSFKDGEERRLELVEATLNANKSIANLKQKNTEIENEIKYYKPWENLELSLADVVNTRYTTVHTGLVNLNQLEKFENRLAEVGALYKVVGEFGRVASVIFYLYADGDIKVQDVVKDFDYDVVTFKNEEKYVREIIETLELEKQANLELITKYENDLEAYAKDYNEVLVLEDKLLSDQALASASVNETYSTVYLVGWVREDRTKVLEKAVSKTTDIYDLAYIEPEEGEVIPTATKNGKFASAFEPITNMFSVPSSNDVDPNLVMGFWYWLIFGMMMGDAGYGFVLSLLMFILIKATKPKGGTYKMYKMLFYGGFATIFWGVMFSSYFGFSLHEPIILNPQEDILDYMILALAVGGLHLISGYLLKAYNDFRNGRIFAGIVDNFAWIFLILGIGLMFALPDSKVGMILALVGAAMIVLTHGRASKNIFGKLGGGLYSLYNSVGVFSDILSYSRILALSLSSAIIGYVMNILAGMLHGSIIGIIMSVFVYIGGHIFNLVMGLLSAYVHDSRLQYIEFFGKFYEGGGVEFKPLSLNLKNIDKIEKVEI